MHSKFVRSVLVISWLLIIVQLSAGKGKYTEQELKTWVAPAKIRRDYNYYLAGNDYDGQPVFVMEFGKWSVRRLIQDGTTEDEDNLDKYLEQMIYRWGTTGKQSASNNGTGSYAVLVDLEGYHARELASARAVATFVGLAQLFQNTYAHNIDYAFFLNTNYIAENLLKILKPALGQVFARTETLGTNKSKWIPKLLKKIPKESLPSWYGGVQDFKPVAVYG